MASSEDAFDDAVRIAGAGADTPWRPGGTALAREPQLDRADWLRALFGFFHFGRRAPAPLV